MIRNNLIATIAALGLIFQGSSVNASISAEEATFIFNSDKGFTLAAGNCTAALVSELGFKAVLNSDASESVENLRNSSLQIQSQIPNLSLIKLRNEAPQKEFLAVEVAGISVNPEVELNSDKIEPNAQGFIFNKSLKSLKDYVVELTDDVVLEDETVLAEVPNVNVGVKGAFLQAAMSGGKFIVMNCGDNEYAAFDVQVGEIHGVVARIGVSLNDSTIFNNIRVHTAAQAEKAILDSGEKKRQQQAEVSERSAQLTAPQQSEENSEPSEELTDTEEDTSRVLDTTPIVAANFYESVVCLENKDSSLNVRSEDQKEVLFKIGNGESIKVVQDLNGNTPKEYVQVQIQRTGKMGWVASSFVKQSSECDSIESDQPNIANTSGANSDSSFALGEYTVCTESGSALTVYDMDFKQLAKKFFLDSGEKATVIDGTLRDKPKPNGYKYVKVTTESNYTRYIAKDFLTQNKCDTAVDEGSSSNGFIFPTYARSGFSYISSGRRPSQDDGLKAYSGYLYNWGVYGANRAGGRAHAATDIYQPLGLKRPSSAYSHSHFGGAFRAMTGGKVVRGSTAFYLGTNYVVVHHDDNVVSRYGEIYPGALVSKGDRVNTGKKLGYIKWVGVGGVPPMLHFENYKPGNNDVRNGRLQGSKMIGGKNSQRSKHLFDRTTFMKELEQSTF